MLPFGRLHVACPGNMWARGANPVFSTLSLLTLTGSASSFTRPAGFGGAVCLPDRYAGQPAATLRSAPCQHQTLAVADACQFNKIISKSPLRKARPTGTAPTELWRLLVSDSPACSEAVKPGFGKEPIVVAELCSKRSPPFAVLFIRAAWCQPTGSHAGSP